MAGNVEQWCGDLGGAYTKAGVIEPTGPVTGFNRIRRGGSWGNNKVFHRSAYRYGSDPNDYYYDVGFAVFLFR